MSVVSRGVIGLVLTLLSICVVIVVVGLTPVYISDISLELILSTGKPRF